MKKQNYQFIVLRIYDILISDKSYDFILADKNKNSRRKFGFTLYDIEDFLLSISEQDLCSDPEGDRDVPGDELFIFKKEILNNIIFYVKIKKDNKVKYDRIKILSCHEDENSQEVFDREIEIENDSHLYDIYKKQNNLLTNAEIKK